MANTVINTPELLNLDSTTGATVLAKGTISERPLSQTFSVEYLAVAGGGGGGYQDGGGGGAGGFVTDTLSGVNSGQSYTLTIGEGAAGGTKSPAVVNSGDNTVITYGSTNITAIGGGGGSSDNNVVSAASGGSGGGGASGSGTRTGGSGTTGQGNAGGDGNASNQGGGGGGAGAAGQNANSSGANGGIGLTTTIISTTNATTASVGEVSGGNLYFAGGGGGDNRTVFGNGGLGGGSDAAANPIDAAANTGGGGGSAFGGSPVRGGAGGSGVVILKYDSSLTLTKGSGLTEAPGSPFTEGSYKVSVFTQGTGDVTLSIPTTPLDAIDGTLRFNTDTNKTEYFDGTSWYEIVDEYASGFIGPATNYFDTKLYTGNGSTQSIGGYIKGAASFNGSSSRIENIDTSPLSTATSFSVSAWIKTTDTGRNFIYGDTKYINNTILGIDNNRIEARSVSSPSVFSSTLTISDGNWHNIVMTVVSGGAFKVYFDKSEVINSTVGSFSSASGYQTIGVYRSLTPTYVAFFNGSIDQVRIYDTALSSTDITALYGETAATASTAAFPSGQTAIATYTMDTSANGLLNTQDLSTVDYPSGAGCYVLYEMNGNSNDTNNTYNGTPTNITYQGGAFDQAAVFNGSNSKIDTGISSISSPFSVSMWINEDVLDSGLFFGNWNSTSADMYWQTTSDGRLRISIDGFSQQYFGTAGDVTAKTWHHIAVALGSGVYEVYLNGTSLGTSTTSVTTFSSGQNFMIGNSSKPSTPLPFDGLIDQVRIFNTKLTQSQVTTLARGIATSYSGSATNVNFNGHLDFTPGLTWVKARDAAHDHVLVDSVNGAGSNKGLSSNAAYYEGQYTATYGYISSLDSNGFTVSAGSSYANYTNVNNEDYVSWNWKAGGTAVINNDGTVASQVSANKDSGFSIVKYTGNGISTFQDVGTGLSQECDIVFIKNLTNSLGASWIVQQNKTDTSKYLYLNDVRAESTSTAFQVDINTGKGTFGFTSNNRGVNQLNDEYIGYCWHSVAGYSKMGGSYSGTGSSGNAITGLGFRPNWLMVKRTDVSGGSWLIVDNRRVENNGNLSELFANTTTAETGTGYDIDFTSDGFTLNTTTSNANASGTNNYIYMAIA